MEQTLIPDTHAFVKEMTAAGMPQPVAEAFVSNYTKYLLGNLATKQDIQESIKATTTAIEGLRKETTTVIEGLRKETTTVIEGLRKETTTAIEGLRKETTTAIEGLRKDTKIELAQLEAKLTDKLATTQFKIIVWNTGALATFTGLALAAAKLLL